VALRDVGSAQRSVFRLPGLHGRRLRGVIYGAFFILVLHFEWNRSIFKPDERCVFRVELSAVGPAKITTAQFFEV
jgi:hypothetical protein